LNNDQSRRLKALFEHCAANTLYNAEIDFSKNEAGRYCDLQTEHLYMLWLSGHNQGVVDHAVARGDVRL
jgi:hypothetical protein